MGARLRVLACEHEDVTAATVLLVHGAWHGAWCYAPLQAELDRRGIPSLAVDLPGHGASHLPLSDLYGDAQYVADTLARIDGPVVLVGHSYGGAVIGEAATRFSSNVTHLVYLAAFVLDTGEALVPYAQTLPRTDNPLAGAIRPSEDGTTSTVDLSMLDIAFYAHCPPGTAEAAGPRLSPQPFSTFMQPVTGAPWHSIPSTYVACRLDGAVPFAHQEVMAQRCAQSVVFDTDHSPFASMPTETAELLERIARA
jgi:pimeloyl-ACP methyl ester carboxylesterase